MIPALRLPRGALEWDAHLHPGSFASGQAFDHEFATQQRSALPHPQQAHRFCIRYLRPRNASPIIAYFQNNLSAARLQFYLHVSRASVPDDVGERFLKNPKERCVQFRIERAVRKLNIDVAADPGARLKFIGLPFERRSQPEMIEYARTQFAGYASHRLNG